MIFVDAGPLIAFFNSRDNYHDQAVRKLEQLYRSGNKMITTNRVAAEVYDAIRYDRRISKKKDARKALTVFEALSKAEDFISVEFLSEDIERRAIAVLRAYPDQNFSYCDACSFIFIEASRLVKIFTFDKKDFQIYKFKRKATFINPEN